MKQQAPARNHAGQGALTLVELLVILALLSLLLAVFLPLLARVNGGRRNPCMSNQRQIYIAMFDYAMDHGDKFPAEGSLVEDYRVLQDNIGEAADLFVCPKSTEKPAVYMSDIAQANTSYDYAEGLTLADAGEDIPLTRDKTRPPDSGGWAPVHFRRGRRAFWANVGFSDGHVEKYTNTVEALGTPTGAMWRLAGEP